MKKLVSLKLSKQTVPTKIENARHYVTVMTGNPNFTTPSPTLASITTAVNALETAYNAALGGGKVLTATMHDKEAILDNLLTQLGHYVEGVANGSETIILSAGMTVKASTGPRGTLGFVIKNGERGGEVKLSTKSQAHHAYMWQVVLDPLPDESAEVDPTHTWELMAVTTKASIVKVDLEIGEKYWFRVATVGKNGQNDWSNPISKMISE